METCGRLIPYLFQAERAKRSNSHLVDNSGAVLNNVRSR